MRRFSTIPLNHAVLFFGLAQAIRMMIFTFPISVFFFQLKGLTTGDMFLSTSIFFGFSLLLEIPTGYIGDLFSRKRVIVTAFIFALIGTLIWLFLDGWFVFLGSLCFSTYYILYSGTGDAYLFDVLKKQNRENEYLKQSANIKKYCYASGFFATFTGGAIFQKFGLDVVLFIELMITIIPLFIVCFLPDIKEYKRVVEKGKSKWKDILEICKYAVTHAEIKWLIIFPALFASASYMLKYGEQPLMESKMVPVYLFGFILGFIRMTQIITSHYASKLFHKLKTKRYTELLFFILCIGCLIPCLIPIIENKFIIYIGLIVTSICAGAAIGINIVANSMINHRIKSDERATILSILSMATGLFSAIVLLASKLLIDYVSLQANFVVVGVIIVALTFISMWKLLRLKL